MQVNPYLFYNGNAKPRSSFTKKCWAPRSRRC